jgi:hypothetical protein
MMFKGPKNFSTEGIFLFSSFRLKHWCSPATRTIFGGSGCGKEGGRSPPDANSSKTS